MKANLDYRRTLAQLRKVIERAPYKDLSEADKELYRAILAAEREHVWATRTETAA